MASNDYRCIPEDPFRGLHLPDGTTASYQPYSFRTGSNTVGNSTSFSEEELLLPRSR